MNQQNSMHCHGWISNITLSGEEEEGVGGINGSRRRLDLGGVHIIQCTDDESLNCAPETSISSSSVILNKFNKKEKNLKIIIILREENQIVQINFSTKAQSQAKCNHICLG